MTNTFERDALITGSTIAGSGDEATFIEWFLPPDPAAARTPLVFVHGGSHDGRCYTQTPDGRIGWAPYVAMHGRPAYVVDWAGTGRSPAVSDLAHLSLATIARGVARAVSDVVGDAVLVTHSMGGVVGWRVATTIPDRVTAIVAIAPGPPAELQPPLTRDDLEALQADNAAYAASGRPFMIDEREPHFVPPELARAVWANSDTFPHDAFDRYVATLLPCSARAINERNNIAGLGLTIGGPAALGGIPVVILTGDQDPRHPRAADVRIADYFGAEFIYLPDAGLHGHGHMQMIEHGNEAIADLFLAWLAKNRR